MRPSSACSVGRLTGLWSSLMPAWVASFRRSGAVSPLIRTAGVSPMVPTTLEIASMPD